MSARAKSQESRERRGLARIKRKAALFSALGDESRLALVLKLSDGSAQSISELCAGENITRQAITKHLVVLQDAGLVESEKNGRQNVFQLKRERLTEAQKALELISQQWDDALSRLKYFVEE